MTFYPLNTGLVLRALAEPWWRHAGDGLPHGLGVLSCPLRLAAILTFVYAMQARAKTEEMVLHLRSAREVHEGQGL